MIRRLFCALIACMCICGGARADALPAMNRLIRLHVVAQDDSPTAQALKLALRDTCLRCARACIAGAPDADSAYMRLQAHTDDFRSACEDRARKLGYTGAITAETGIFPFPDRIYGSLAVPAGDYRALRITIGAGGGRNWWCVLYPSLCLLDEANDHTPGGVLAWLRSRIGGA